MNMRKQQGMSLIGFLIVLVHGGIFRLPGYADRADLHGILFGQKCHEGHR